MEMYFEIWRTTIMWVGLFALSILVPILVAAKVFPPLNRAFKRFRKLPKWEQALTMFFVAVLTIYAAIKPETARITFENGLKDDGSYVTNDIVHIEWVKSGIPYVPDMADVYIDYRPIEYRQSDEGGDRWTLLGQTTVGAYEFNTTLANATNYDYNVWYHYKPETVHTNGVWEYRTTRARKQTPDTLEAIPLRATTKGDGRAIATPSAKRKEEDNQ